MGFINNIKTRTKLILSFTLILIISLLTGVNELYTASDLQKSLENFYNDNYLANMMLNRIQLNHQKAVTEMQRILYKTEVMHDKTVVETSVKVLNELVRENDQLIQDYSAKNFLPGEKELFESMLAVNATYRTVRGEIIKMVENGDFYLAAQLYDQEAIVLLEEVFDYLSQIVELNDQAVIDVMAANRAEYRRSFIMAAVFLSTALLIGIALAFILTRTTVGPIAVLVKNALHMAEGDFTRQVPERLKHRKDEMGMLANAFSEMNIKVGHMLKSVSESVEATSAASEELSATAEEVSAQGESVSSSVQQIAAGMEEISASIEEVAASSHEIRSKFRDMEKEARESETKVAEIRKRAESMKNTARLSKQIAHDIYDQKQQEIKQAIDEMKIVEEVTRMADVITQIAGQTNLLALNAAIEASHAGENGRGFAVVAEEVRKLAESSAVTAREIHHIIQQVKSAALKLTCNTEEILKFIDDKVTPDYDMLEKTGEQYAEDAEFVERFASGFAAAASRIAAMMEDIGKSIDSVAATVEEAASSTEEISNSTMETAKALDEVAGTAQSQAEMAEKLQNLISKFRL